MLVAVVVVGVVLVLLMLGLVALVAVAMVEPYHQVLTVQQILVAAAVVRRVMVFMLAARAALVL
jgi:hypothetical protein